jgi:serine/threonine protein kinase
MNPGDILDGRYEITARLGAGGMGEVYKATHVMLGAPRVIKVVHPHIAANADARDRFMREARVATKVQHHNVATFHDFASLPDGSHYMVWEFIDGENLAERLRSRGTLPPRQAVQIAVQALHGLEAIHKAGIIHRDISPENLMITKDGTVKIIDLGVAKMDDPEAVSQTRTGIFVGKLRYAAPEQLGFLPEGEKIDGRADIYALAMCVFELLTGRPPYEAKSPHEYFLHHAREVTQTNVILPPHLPGSEALQRVLEKALARNRNDRFASAREFAVALEEIERTLPDPVNTATLATPIDPDETWRPSQGFEQTLRTPSPAAAPLLSAEPTVQTPMPAYRPPTEQTPMPVVNAPKSRVWPVALVVLLAVLLIGGGGAFALWPTIKPFIAPEAKPSPPPSAEKRAVVTPPQPQPAQATVTATPETTSAAVVEPLSAPVVTNTTPLVTNSEPKHVQPREERRKPAEIVSTYNEPAPRTYNDHAIDRLRRELRGVKTMTLLAGSDTTMLYRAIHRRLPELEFDGESNVVVHWDTGRYNRGAASSITITKDDRTIFVYQLPYGDSASAAEAFAQTLADAMEP